MKLGIIGLPGSGKTTVFKALTGGMESAARKNEPAVGVVKINDERLNFLADYHKPKKVTPAQVEYLDLAGISEGKSDKSVSDKALAYIRTLDAFVHCVRFFDSPLLEPPDPMESYKDFQEEMILADLVVVEKRLERITKEVQRGRKDLSHELNLLKEAYALLDSGQPLLNFPNVQEITEFKSYAFLSAKPQLVLVNAGEKKSRAEITRLLGEIQQAVGERPHTVVDWLYADAEAEIASLPEEDAKEFLGDLELEEGAKDRIIKTSFSLLNLIVFFTAGEPEVRAWQLPKGKTALKAAGVIHSDIERGFIRAELVSYSDFKSTGSMAAAQKAGRVRLEGKDYIMQDGDIVLFRFNV